MPWLMGGFIASWVIGVVVLTWSLVHANRSKHAVFRALRTRRGAVVAGIVLPTLCFVVDPIVFRGSRDFIEPLLGEFRAAGYAGALLSVLGLICSSLTSRKSSVLSGWLLGGAAYAWTLGAALFPYALFGISFLGIGFLGFSPFVVALVYVAAARRHDPEPDSRSPLAFVSAAVLLVVTFGAQLGIERWATSQVDQIIAAPADGDAAAERLRLLRFVTPPSVTDRLVQEHRERTGRQNEDEACVAIERHFQTATGESLAERLYELLD